MAGVHLAGPRTVPIYSFRSEDETSSMSQGSQARLVGTPTAAAGSFLAMLAQLVLHFACFLSNISTLIIYWYFNEKRFFWALMITWLVASAFMALVALRDMKPVGVLRTIWVVLVFGVLRGMQVRHILRFFRQRRNLAGGSVTDADLAQLLEPSAFNSKTFDGILEGFFFALGNQFAYFMLDLAPPYCPWYMTEHFDAICSVCKRFRFLFLFSAFCSMLTLAAAVVEVDYRVSVDVRGRINSRPSRAFLHFSYRASEVVISMSAINLICIFLRPQWWMQGVAGPYLLYMPIVSIWAFTCLILYLAARSHGADQDFLLAHAAVALASIAVNPTQFVDRPIYLGAARTISRTLFALRFVQVCAGVAFICFAWRTPFPPACTFHDPPALQPPRKIGRYTLWKHSNHGLAYFEMTVAFAVHTAIIVLNPYVRKVWTCLRCESLQSGPPEQEFGAFLATSAADSLKAEVRRSVPRGLSSFLVQAGTGVTSRLFADKEYEVTDFRIEKVIGRGGYAVVVLVKALWRGGEPLAPRSQHHYALKLQNVSDYWRATYADREREYLVKLNEHNHPFIMRLESFLDVPEDHAFPDITGQPVTDARRNSRFHKALMMEYCPQGDLEAFLQERALPATAILTPPPDGVESLEESLRWLDTARRFSAQLMEAVRFLHGENFTHRDLKPGNVLLKTGHQGLHVCITDFGFAKQQGEDDELRSVAGDAEYMAPEIRETWNSGMWVGQNYTSAVDLWSLGKMILVMLWGAKFRFHQNNPNSPWHLQTPKLEWLPADERGHPRVPCHARILVKQMMEQSADMRGTAAQLVQHPFFAAFEHRGTQLPAMDYSNCRRR